MKNNVIALIAGLGLSSGAIACPEFLDTEMRKLSSKETINFCESYAGKPMLIVNTASNCGYTPQFSGLESLHQEYKDKGLVVVGFSSDDFFQEENDEADAATVCFESTSLIPSHGNDIGSRSQCKSCLQGSGRSTGLPTLELQQVRSFWRR